MPRRKMEKTFIINAREKTFTFEIIPQECVGLEERAPTSKMILLKFFLPEIFVR
jgi:hypothetical protein